MPSLRLIAWNCRHGQLTARLSELAAESPDIVFVQECLPMTTAPLTRDRLVRRVGARKGIALASLNPDYGVTRLRSRKGCGLAVVAATVKGPVSFAAVGIWSQGPAYADDVMRTLDAYARVIRSGPSVVMGDLNSGTNLKKPGAPSKGHSRIIARLKDLGLVSAYHAFHSLEHGREQHPTYRHQFNASQPWHIDFCFVPAAWIDRLVRVAVVGGDEWPKRSDHFPLLVDLQF